MLKRDIAFYKTNPDKYADALDMEEIWLEDLFAEVVAANDNQPQQVAAA
jgi:hypothetical protein